MEIPLFMWNSSQDGNLSGLRNSSKDGNSLLDENSPLDGNSHLDWIHFPNQEICCGWVNILTVKMF